MILEFTMLQAQLHTLKHTRLVASLILSGLSITSISANATCGGAFCNLSTDWDSQGVANKPGIRLDVRAEFIDLDQLRHGTHKTKPAGEVDEHDEVRTINRNFLATLDWNINPTWGVTFKVPMSDRSHTHIHNEDDGLGGVDPEVEKWDFSGLGDVQAIGRYRFYNEQSEHGTSSNAGLRFGVKLPTGTISKKNSEGELAERTLQPGTGSVDSLLGAYYNYRTGATTWFAQGMWQQSVHERDDFKPGRKLNADFGFSYSATPDLSLLLQLNLQHKAKDSGVNAEPEDSGSRSVNLSPGFSYRVASGTQVYGFLQKPIYQHVNGVQLTADWSVAFGLNTTF
jgi:hypothetical protein